MEAVCSNLKIKVSQEAVTKGSLYLINRRDTTGIRILFSLYDYYRNTLSTALSKKLHQFPERITGTTPVSLFMHFNLGGIEHPPWGIAATCNFKAEVAGAC